ncbi:hypothetical protein PTI98_007627 [Pleurotus ostreatus]|nr:hypothetical protein PTI98_007627 [Pleurotus ostreatus]
MGGVQSSDMRDMRDVVGVGVGVARMDTKAGLRAIPKPTWMLRWMSCSRWVNAVNAVDRGDGSGGGSGRRGAESASSMNCVRRNSVSNGFESRNGERARQAGRETVERGEVQTSYM